MSTQEIYDRVHSHYSQLARETGGGGAANANGGKEDDDSAAYARRVAEAFGYSAQELAEVPEGANLGLSCGNPLVVASLREGETVVDLGSGAGFDVFQAAKKVGDTGKVIGIDMSKDMIARAEATATKHAINNVSFKLSPITSLPLEDDSVDCIISNCVINLVPDADKPAVFREMFRVLKPGGRGRVAVSDILAKKELPDDIRNDLDLVAGCIAGASRTEQYFGWLGEAGFEEKLIVPTGSDLNVYKNPSASGGGQGCCGPEQKTAAAAPVAAPAETTTKSSSSSGGGGGCCSSKSGCGPPSTSSSAKQEEEAAAAAASVSNGVSSAPSASASEEKPSQNGSAVAGLADVDLNEWVGSYSVYAVKR